MKMIFVRHGETEWNRTKRYQGQVQIPLNERGKEQAHRSGERLKRRNLVALYASDTARAWETARIIGEHIGLQPQPMAELREIDVGQWEGLTTDELYHNFPEHMQVYDADPANTVRLGGESYAELQQRALVAFQRIQQQHNPGETIGVVSHGGTIRTILCAILGLDLANFSRLWMENGSFTEVQQRNQGWFLNRLNDAAHLENISTERGGID